MDTAQVIVTVLNENDHNPIFTQQTYTFQKDWEQDSVIGTVQVSQQLSYRILVQITY